MLRVDESSDQSARPLYYTQETTTADGGQYGSMTSRALLHTSSSVHFDKPFIAKCKMDKAKLANGVGFFFREGFNDSMTPNRSIDNLAEHIARTSSYVMEDVRKSLNIFQLYGPGGEAFRAIEFLRLLSNRSMGVVGDSLGLQLFQALDAELHPLANTSTSMDGNGTHLFYDYNVDGTPNIDRYPSIHAAIRFYDDYNVTLRWCKHSLGLALFNMDIDAFCLTKTLASDVLVLALGAHYKPPETSRTLQEYYHMVQKQADEFQKEMLRTRGIIQDLYQQSKKHRGGTTDGDESQLLHEVSPHRQQVIWRLNSHVGPIDEFNAIFPDGHDYRHPAKYFWDDFTARDTAAWVPAFNSITRSIADMHSDYILDHYQLSKAMLRYRYDRSILLNRTISSTEFLLHADSLHYAAGGLFRAGNIMLQKLIEHDHICRRRPTVTVA